MWMYFIADGPINGGAYKCGGEMDTTVNFQLLEVYSSITVGTFFSNFLDFSQLAVDSSKNKTAKG